MSISSTGCAVQVGPAWPPARRRRYCGCGVDADSLLARSQLSCLYLALGVLCRSGLAGRRHVDAAAAAVASTLTHSWRGVSFLVYISSTGCAVQVGPAWPPARRRRYCGCCVEADSHLARSHLSCLYLTLGVLCRSDLRGRLHVDAAAAAVALTLSHSWRGVSSLVYI